MSAPEQKNFFTILEQVNESSLKIQENLPESVEEQIEIETAGPAKTEDGQKATLYKTTKGRQFARLDNWPQDLLLEITES